MIILEPPNDLELSLRLIRISLHSLLTKYFKMFIQAQYCSLAKSWFLAFVSYITNQASFRSAPNNVLSYGKSAIGIMSVGRIEA